MNGAGWGGGAGCPGGVCAGAAATGKGGDGFCGRPTSAVDQVTIQRHDSWAKFEQWRREKSFRLILFSTKGALPYLDYRYTADDILLFGRESAGVPDDVVAAADARLVIPIEPGLRSLNVAMAAAMALGEALRQTESRENGMRTQ